MAAFVQSANASGEASASTIARAFPANIGTGGRLLRIVVVCDGAKTVSTVSDTLSTTYARATSRTHFMTIEEWYGLATNAGGANTVTATFTGSVPYRRIAVHEYSGNAGTGLLDQVLSAEGDSTTPASGSVTTTEANELLMGSVVSEGAFDTTLTPGTNETWTKREDFGHTNNLPVGTMDVLKVPAGATNAQWTFGTSNPWLCCIATYKTAVGFYERLLAESGAVKIPIHQFSASLAERARGKFTSAQIATQYSLSGAEQTDMDTLYNRLSSGSPLLTTTEIHEVLMLAERNVAYGAVATLKTRLGV